MEKQLNNTKIYKPSSGSLAVSFGSGIFIIIWTILMILGSTKFDGLFIVLFAFALLFIADGFYRASSKLIITGNEWRTHNKSIDITQLAKVDTSLLSSRNATYVLTDTSGKTIRIVMTYSSQDLQEIYKKLIEAIDTTHAKVSERTRFRLKLKR